MTVVTQPDPRIGPAGQASAPSSIDAGDQEHPPDAASDQSRSASEEIGQAPHPGGAVNRELVVSQDRTEGQEPEVSSGAFGSHIVAGRYRLIEPLGRGGMGRVYLGHDELLDRPIAVKLIYDDAVSIRDQRQACAVEARAAARVSHPGVVRILDSGFDDGHCFVVMELAEGKTLAEILRERGALPIARALGIAAQVTDALEAAHLQGVVHCDVKPGNLIVDSFGRVRLVDFGIARVASSSTGLSDQDIHGSAKYVAPEQVEGTDIDGRTDLYALGVVLFEMLAGQPPFEGGNLASILAQRLVTDPPSVQALRPAVPDEVERIVRRAMARDPARRFQAAGDLRDALRTARAAQQDTERAFRAGTDLDWTAPDGRRGAVTRSGPLPHPSPAMLRRWPSLPSAVGILALLGLIAGMAVAQCGMAGVSTDAASESVLAAAPTDTAGQAPVAPAAVQAEPPVAAVPPPTLIPAPTVATSQPAAPPPTGTPLAVPEAAPANPTGPTDAPPVQALAAPAVDDRRMRDDAAQPVSDESQPAVGEQVKQRGNGPPDEQKQPEAASPAKPAPPAEKPRGEPPSPPQSGHPSQSQGGPPGQVKKQAPAPPPATKPRPGGGNAQHGGNNGHGNGNSGGNTRGRGR
jgi:serine/threonine-protein kinase